MSFSELRRSARRVLLNGVALAALGALLPMAPASAQFRVEISGVGATQIPVAIGRFRDESRSPAALSAIVQADLERSGLFRVLDASADRLDDTSRPALPDWRSKGADALLAGSVTQLADGRFDVRYHLWDVLKGKDQGGLSLVVPAADLRQAAHRIADDIYEKLTGDRGAFATRIAYVSKGGSKYHLIVAADQSTARHFTCLGTRWTPVGLCLF
jgi:TolB protein